MRNVFCALPQDRAMPLTGANSTDDTDESDLNKTENYADRDRSDPGTTLDRVLRELERVNLRLDRIESRPVLQQFDTRQKSPPSDLRADFNPRDCLDQGGPVSAGSLKDTTTDLTEFKDIQEKFNVIKSSVDKVILPSQLKLHDSRAGIKREDQPVLNVVSKCGRYIETVLKLISESDEGKPVDLASISISLVANLKFLQDEYAALLVKGRFDNNTAQLFRSLQKNNSGFDEASLANVRAAAELSSVATRFQPNQTYRGRGGYRGNYRGRGNRDIFHNLQSSNFPKFRPPFNQNSTKDQEDS
ncbi:MAG: hypothetical protein AB2693_11675 [Candidatus Thiodiazotropha sp.]